MEELFLKYKQRGRENGELIIERAQLRTDNTGLKERVKNKQKELEQEQEKLEKSREKVHKFIEANGQLELKTNNLNFQILELKEKVVKLEGEKEDLQKQLEATGVPK